MEVIFVLIGISLILAVTFLVLFIRALKSGQYDDTYTPSVRMLFDKNKQSDTRKRTTKSK
ncbi:cbb3-type cytochrome oxidase assembly protein CcoS [Echinicola strongylocentroti]|uniref:Cbb3-type cytochrome oxidase assembly protein CcoS n=1 Tax=Echinicola strongylocentroti TaxID=1795355 RepID=A0A2Z4IMP2_9BACT|nr:cbb3-type cytochrome oxidase assembly protein CcoS [Echinicola strongylocentroti]AWW32381.1 cbb3-type cytochrome oxidase assembly protein CcoS [Echinicola strongylocentroti]